MTDPMLDNSLEATLARVDAVFTPGTLAAKRAEMAGLRERGDSMLFEGAINWNIFLTDSDRRLSGASESLDHAFADMIACLDHLALDTDGATPVQLAVQLTDAGDAPPL